MVARSLAFFTVERYDYNKSPFYTRLGLVTYATNASVYRSLGTMDNNDVFNLDTNDLPGDNNTVTNMKGGLETAVNELYGVHNRHNARKVIALFASSYNDAGANAPNEVANQFKGDGGILITFDYESEETGTAVFGTISSPGYYMSNAFPYKDSYVDLNQAFCDANCFCKPLYEVFTSSPRQTPTAGCYRGYPVTASYPLASKKCNQDSAYLAHDETPQKTLFLSSLFNDFNPIIIGLGFDIVDGQYEWNDGTPLQSSYEPWAQGSPLGSAAACVFVNQNMQWVSTDCRNGYYYICEAIPCDSDNYCT